MPISYQYGMGSTQGLGTYSPWGGGVPMSSYDEQALFQNWERQNAARTAQQSPTAPVAAHQAAVAQQGQNPLATMLQSSGAFGTNTGRPNINVTTGIEAGPVWSPQQVQQGTNAIRHAPQTLQGSVAQQGSTMPQAAQAAAQQQLSDATAQGNSQSALQFSRQASQANAKQDLESQRARAFSGGLPWMNLAISDYQGDAMDQMRRGSALANLLSSMV